MRAAGAFCRKEARASFAEYNSDGTYVLCNLTTCGAADPRCNVRPQRRRTFGGAGSKPQRNHTCLALKQTTLPTLAPPRCWAALRRACESADLMESDVSFLCVLLWLRIHVPPNVRPASLMVVFDGCIDMERALVKCRTHPLVTYLHAAHPAGYTRAPAASKVPLALPQHAALQAWVDP